MKQRSCFPPESWPQFLSLWGVGSEPARYELVLKREPLPWMYVAAFLFAVLLFEVLPYMEEFLRGLWVAEEGLAPKAEDDQ